MKRMRWLAWGTMVGAVATAVACSSSSDDGNDLDLTNDSGTGTDSSLADSGGSDATATDSGPGDAGPVCTVSPCVVAVAVGGRHSCAQIDDGTLRCWGNNSLGALGVGTYDGGGLLDPAIVATPTAAAGVTGLGSVGLGGIFDGESADFSCALDKTGTVGCWGVNNAQFRSLGRGDAGDTQPLVLPQVAPVAVPGPYAQLSVGTVTSCVLDSAGAVSCWGYNNNNQVSTSTTLPINAPAKIVGAPALTKISTGVFHTCGIAADKKVWCWGSPQGGELGRAITDGGVNDIAPGTVDGLTDAIDIASSYFSSCALTSDGVAHCWGLSPILGRGGDFDASTSQPIFEQAPVAMPSGVTFKQLTAHFGGFCGLTAGGDVWCWGINQYGLDGPVDGGDAGNGAPPPAVAPSKIAISNVIQIAGSPAGGHLCALVSGGSVKCWGLNTSAELGTAPVDGGAPFTTTPLDVHF